MISKINCRNGKVILSNNESELHSLSPESNLLRISGDLNEVIITEDLLNNESSIKIDLNIIETWSIDDTLQTTPLDIASKWLYLQNNYFNLYMLPLKVSLNPAHVDQAGRVRTSEQIPLGDYKLVNDRIPLFFDTVVNGTATVTHEVDLKAHDMATAADGDYAIVQTSMSHNYFAGKAHFVELTSFNFSPAVGALKRSGYFRTSEVAPYNTSLDGFFLETDNGGEHELVIMNNGVEVTRIPQSQWDDPLDGTCRSKILIDWDKFNVFQYNFLWLGGTGLRISIVIGSKVYEVHNYKHANGPNADKLIFSSPNQTIRFELRQTGVGTQSFQPVCCTVATEGSESSANIGSIRTIHTDPATAITAVTAGINYAIKAWRLKDSHKDVTIDLVDVAPFVTSNNDFYSWELFLNPTITGGTLSFTPVTDSAIEEADGNGTLLITDNTGVHMGGGYGVGQASTISSLKSARKLGSKIDGTRDYMVLVITPLAGSSNLKCFGTVVYKEFI